MRFLCPVGLGGTECPSAMASVAPERVAMGSSVWMAPVIVVMVALLVSLAASLLHANGYGRFSAAHTERGAALVQQALQWHRTSAQDRNPMFAARHANYAIAYLSAARSMLPDQVLEQLAGVQMHDLAASLDASQRRSARLVTTACPKANPAGLVGGTAWLQEKE
jgi:hypothetical protein